MLVAQRHKEIVDLVNKRGSVRVSELSGIFLVTEETIRRDLYKLEKEKMLFRSHGGAVKVNGNQLEIPHSEREITNVNEKMRIAKEAINYIETNDRIILDASTTAYYMAKSLPNIPLTVLTNSLKVATELATKSSIQVISTGGTLLSRSMSFTGPLADRSLSSYHVNKSFISCKGLHLENGLSESSELQAIIKKKMIEISDKVYILVDSSKFNVQAFAHVSSLNDIDFVITDKKCNQKYFNMLLDVVNVTKV